MGSRSPSGMDYTCLMGEQMISPTGQLSEAIPLTNFINDRLLYAGRYRAPPAKYTIQSHLLSRVPGGDASKSQEKVGGGLHILVSIRFPPLTRHRLIYNNKIEITWRIEILKT